MIEACEMAGEAMSCNACLCEMSSKEKQRAAYRSIYDVTDDIVGEPKVSVVA